MPFTDIANAALSLIKTLTKKRTAAPPRWRACVCDMGGRLPHSSRSAGAWEETLTRSYNAWYQKSGGGRHQGRRTTGSRGVPALPGPGAGVRPSPQASRGARARAGQAGSRAAQCTPGPAPLRLSLPRWWPAGGWPRPPRRLPASPSSSRRRRRAHAQWRGGPRRSLPPSWRPGRH